MIAVSRLLKSWATPPANCPTASIFWDLPQLVIPLAEFLLRPRLSAGVHRDPYHLLDDARVIKHRGEPGDEMRSADVGSEDAVVPVEGGADGPSGSRVSRYRSNAELPST